MKIALLLSFLIGTTSMVQAQDSVDDLVSKNQTLMRDGLTALHKRHLAELETVKDTAMTGRKLDLANKADSKIERLTEEISKLQLGVPEVSELVAASDTQSKDAVDKLNSKYVKLMRDGLKTLQKKYIGDLEILQNSAMKKKDLGLANIADAKIKILKENLAKLESSGTDPKGKNQKFPTNQFYRMTSSTPRLGSEKGKEIVCNFARLRNSRLTTGSIVLTLSSNSSKYAETPNDIFILKRSHGKEVGKLAGIGMGKTKKIRLSLKPADELEIAIVVKGGNALHLKPFSEGVPELYLTIEE